MLGFGLELKRLVLKLKSNSATINSDQVKNRNWYIPMGNHYSFNESVISK